MSKSTPAPDDSETPPTASKIAEVRYSLPAMLAELQSERTSGAFSQEKLHQIEIGKLFKNRKKARAKTSS
ncbi:MAG TPA: hypothetical protein VL357_09860 [Rariglobus sp.]|jgi:hypothetical protein|nr:hypothetical protein [Rariglobus sp.]